MKKIIVFLIIFIFVVGTSFAEELRTVIRVVDGDTIILDGEEKVRLIGVDTPETKHPKKPVQYYGKEASAFTKKLCEGKTVHLKYDWQKKDKYQRTLAYVYLEDGTFVNAEIIKWGYGHVYTKFPFKYLEEFRQYEREAREGKVGLWRDEDGAELDQFGNKHTIHIKDNNGFKEIWKKNNETNEEMLLVDEVDAIANEIREMQRITAIYGNKVIVSMDEKYLFFITDAWETSGALFKYDLSSGKLIYLTDAYSVRQITNGEYKGLLVIGKHQYPLAGSAVDLLWMYDPHTRENVALFADDSSPLFDFVEEEYFGE